MSWCRVTRLTPCPACKGTHWCSTTADGELLRCMRCIVGAVREHPLGGWIHQLRAPSSHFVPSPGVAIEPLPDFAPQHADARARTTDAELVRFAQALGLDEGGGVEALRVLGAATWNPRVWCFPMCTARGRIVGLRLRSETGRKWACSGSREGIFLGDRPECPLVFVVEGPTSSAAVLSVGLPVIGRPSALQGAAAWRYLRARCHAREVVVIGETDRKPDGRWPGHEGARAAASGLVLVARSVRVAFPPPEFKDVRDYVVAGADAADVHRLAEAGERVEWTLGDGT